MIFIPNIIWTKKQPIGYEAIVSEENKVLLIFERVGQACVTCSAVIFRDFNPVYFSSWSIWLIVSFVLMLLYEICWVKYFASKRTLKEFYGSFCGIPLPLAVLPVLSFLLLGIYGKVIWLIISVLLLGIGHIGIHAQHMKKLKQKINLKRDNINIRGL